LSLLAGLDIDRGALSDASLLVLVDAPSLCCACAARSVRFHPLPLLLALLAELLQVDFHNILDDGIHLGLVLDHLCDVDDILAFQVVQEVAQALENFLLVLFLVFGGLGRCDVCRFPF